MTRKRKVSWQPGVVFAVPLPDGSFALGQAIALMMSNVVYCALTCRRLSAVASNIPTLSRDDVVSRVALTREQLDYGAWPIVGTHELIADKAQFANEATASSGYVGGNIYDAALAEDFLAAFHAQSAWDDWHDPHFLDMWLVSPDRKPSRLLFRTNAPAS